MSYDALFSHTTAVRDSRGSGRAAAAAALAYRPVFE
jgi:hypothetical protein